MRRLATLSFVIGSLGGCHDEIDLDPYDDTPPVEARVRPKAISGGTLTLVDDHIAVASDPDRDRIFIVDLDAGELLHAIELEPGDEPGRVVEGEDSADLAHVVLRGFGGIATIDVAAGTLVKRTATCADPRGLAYESATASLHVGCADGTLLRLDDASLDIVERTILEPDLRDVFLKDGEVHASLFRTASIVRTDGEYATIPSQGEFLPHVAYKTWVDPTTNAVIVLHQLASIMSIPVDLDDAEASPASTPYGGGGGGGCEPGIVVPALTMIGPDGPSTFTMPGGGPVVDAAISSEGWVALATPGVEPGDASVKAMPLGDFGCLPDILTTRLADAGQVTAVAFTAGDALVMQSREPARISILDDLHGDELRIVDLPGESRFDSGHEIFHRVTESKLACASCHPDGTDDGHVWQFLGIGPRRTQSLEIGIEGTAPFHWDGDMDDLDTLMSEVLTHRMGGMRQSEARRESFAQWLFDQERPKAGPMRDEAELVDEGELLFADYGCAKCHYGEKLGGTTFETFAGKRLQVPSLRRVSLRPPFMHDGREETLEGAVRDMIEGTREGEVSAPDLQAITAYVRTL